MVNEKKTKVFYKISFMLQDGYEADSVVAEALAGQVFVLPQSGPGAQARVDAVDEAYGNEIVISYRSCFPPCDIKSNVWEVFQKSTGYLYADIQYQWPYDITPDRTVIWADGRQQEYMGKVEWIESN